VTTVEVFLDDTPGETRGVIVRDGRPDRLIVQGDDDVAAHRLGARMVGRVIEVRSALRGAFVELPDGGPGFLTLKTIDQIAAGQKLEVEVASEPRDDKGPRLRQLGPAEGEVRLTQAAPTVAERLAVWAPNAQIVTGLEAIRACQEAVETAREGRAVRPELGLDVRVQRTRALIAADFDYTGGPGAAGRKGQARANRAGLAETARLIRLNGWGGLVAVDLVGAGFDARAIADAARQAFDHPQMVLAPVSRFGVLELSLPWTCAPLEARLARPASRMVDAIRALRLALLQDLSSPRYTLQAAPGLARSVASLAGRLGPRASVVADPAIPESGWRVVEGF